MSLNDDFLGGWLSGVLMVLIGWALFTMGSCTHVRTLPLVPDGVDAAKASKECVVKWDRITNCYEKPGE